MTFKSTTSNKPSHQSTTRRQKQQRHHHQHHHQQQHQQQQQQQPHPISPAPPHLIQHAHASSSLASARRTLQDRRTKRSPKEEAAKKHQILDHTSLTHSMDAVVNAVPFEHIADDRMDKLHGYDVIYNNAGDDNNNNNKNAMSGGLTSMYSSSPRDNTISPRSPQHHQPHQQQQQQQDAADDNDDDAATLGLKHRSFQQKFDHINTPLLTQVSMKPDDYKFSRRKDLIFKLDLTDPVWRKKAMIYNEWIAKKFHSVFHQQFQLLLVHYGVLSYPKDRHEWLYPQDHILKGLLKHAVVLHKHDKRVIHPRLDKRTAPQVHELFLQLKMLGVLSIDESDLGQDGNPFDADWKPGIVHPFIPHVPGDFATDPVNVTKDDLKQQLRRYKQYHEDQKRLLAGDTQEEVDAKRKENQKGGERDKNDDAELSELKFETVLDVIKKCLVMAGGADFLDNFLVDSKKPHTHVHLKNNAEQLPPRGDTVESNFISNAIVPIEVDPYDMELITRGLPLYAKLDENGQVIPSSLNPELAPKHVDLTEMARRKVLHGLANLSQRLDRFDTCTLSNMKQLLILVESMKRQDVLTQWFEQDAGNFQLYRKLQHVFLETEKTFRKEAFDREMLLERLIGGFEGHEDQDLQAKYAKEREKMSKFRRMNLDPTTKVPLTPDEMLDIDKKLDLYGKKFNDLPLTEKQKALEIEREQKTLFTKYGFDEYDLLNLKTLITDLYLQNLCYLQYFFQPYQSSLQTTMIRNVVAPELFMSYQTDRFKVLNSKTTSNDLTLIDQETDFDVSDDDADDDEELEYDEEKYKHLNDKEKRKKKRQIEQNKEKRRLKEEAKKAKPPRPFNKHSKINLRLNYDLDTLNHLSSISTLPFYTDNHNNKAHNIIIKTPNLDPTTLYTEHLLGYLSEMGLMKPETEDLLKETFQMYLDHNSNIAHHPEKIRLEREHQRKLFHEAQLKKLQSGVGAEGGDDSGKEGLSYKDILDLDRIETRRRREEQDQLAQLGSNHSNSNTPMSEENLQFLQKKKDLKDKRFAISFQDVLQQLMDVFVEHGVVSPRMKRRVQINQAEVAAGLEDVARYEEDNDSLLPPHIAKNITPDGYIYELPEKYQILWGKRHRQGLPTPFDQHLYVDPSQQNENNNNENNNSTTTQQQHPRLKVVLKLYETEILSRLLDYKLVSAEEMFAQYEFASLTPISIGAYNPDMREVVQEIYDKSLLPYDYNTVHWHTLQEMNPALAARAKKEPVLHLSPMERLLHGAVLTENIVQQVQEDCGEDFYPLRKKLLKKKRVKEKQRLLLSQAPLDNGQQDPQERPETIEDFVKKFNQVQLLQLAQPDKTFPFTFEDKNLAKIIRKQNQELALAHGFDSESGDDVDGDDDEEDDIQVIPGHVVVATESIYKHYIDPTLSKTMGETSTRVKTLEEEHQLDQARRLKAYQDKKALLQSKADEKLTKELMGENKTSTNSNKTRDLIMSTDAESGDDDDARAAAKRRALRGGMGKLQDDNGPDFSKFADDPFIQSKTFEEQQALARQYVTIPTPQDDVNYVGLHDLETDGETDPNKVEFVHKRVGFVQADDVVLDIKNIDMMIDLMEGRMEQFIPGYKRMQFKKKEDTAEDEQKEEETMANTDKPSSAPSPLRTNQQLSQLFNKLKHSSTTPSAIKAQALGKVNAEQDQQQRQEKRAQQNDNDTTASNNNNTKNNTLSFDNVNTEDLAPYFEKYPFLAHPITKLKVKVRYDVWERSKYNDQLIKLNDTDILDMNFHELRKEILQNVQHDMLYNFSLQYPTLWPQLMQDMHCIMPISYAAPYNTNLSELLLTDVKYFTSNLRVQTLLKKKLFHDFYNVFNCVQYQKKITPFFNVVYPKGKKNKKNKNNAFAGQENEKEEEEEQEEQEEQYGDDNEDDDNYIPYIEITFNNMLLNGQEIEQDNKAWFFKRMDKFVKTRQERMKDEFLNGNFDVKPYSVDLSADASRGFYQTDSESFDPDAWDGTDGGEDGGDGMVLEEEVESELMMQTESEDGAVVDLHTAQKRQQERMNQERLFFQRMHEERKREEEAEHQVKAQQHDMQYHSSSTRIVQEAQVVLSGAEDGQPQQPQQQQYSRNTIDFDALKFGKGGAMKTQTSPKTTTTTTSPDSFGYEQWIASLNDTSKKNNGRDQV